MSTSTAPFAHILCWVDGSDEACRAADRAARLAQSLGARLSFLVLGQDLEHDEGFAEFARIERVAEPSPTIVGLSEAACLDEAMAIAAKVGVKDANRLTRSGDPVAAICDVARTGSADLVVIRHQRAGLLERLLGASVADTLSNRCGFAVLSDG